MTQLRLGTEIRRLETETNITIYRAPLVSKFATSENTKWYGIELGDPVKEHSKEGNPLAE